MKSKLMGVAALAALPLLWTSAARAGLLVTYSIDGGTTTTLCSAASGGTCSGSASAHGINIDVQSAQSNSPGTAALADLISSSLSLSNTGSTSGTIVLTIGDVGFTAPTTPPNLNFYSEIGGSVGTGGTANSLSFVSSIDPGNRQNFHPGTYNTAPLTPNVTISHSGFDANDTALITSLHASFSMTDVIDITLSRGSTIGYQAQTDLSPVPEPASLLLLGGGLLGAGLMRRRRKEV